jgi:hypothetical protein
MTHKTAAKISKDIRRCGGLGEYISTFKSTFNFMKLKMTSSTSLRHKVHMEINMFCTVTATDGALRPSYTRLIVRNHRSRCSLRKTKVAKELVKKDHLLNHRRGTGRYELGFS